MGLLASFRLEGAARSDRRPKNSGTRRVWRSWGCRFQLSVLVTGAAGWEAWLSRPGRGGCACPGTSRGVRRQRGSAGSARLGSAGSAPHPRAGLPRVLASRDWEPVFGRSAASLVATGVNRRCLRQAYSSW